MHSNYAGVAAARVPTEKYSGALFRTLCSAAIAAPNWFGSIASRQSIPTLIQESVLATNYSMKNGGPRQTHSSEKLLMAGPVSPNGPPLSCCLLEDLVQRAH